MTLIALKKSVNTLYTVSQFSTVHIIYIKLCNKCLCKLCAFSFTSYIYAYFHFVSMCVVAIIVIFMAV